MCVSHHAGAMSQRCYVRQVRRTGRCPGDDCLQGQRVGAAREGLDSIQGVVCGLANTTKTRRLLALSMGLRRILPNAVHIVGGDEREWSHSGPLLRKLM